MERITRAATALLVLVLGAGGAWADEFKGRFRFGAVTVTPADAIAYRDEVEGKTVALAVFTDFKLDRAAVLEAITPWTGIFEQAVAREGNVVLLRLLGPDRCGAYAYFAKAGRSIGLSDDYPAHMKAARDERAVGDCATAEPRKFFDDTYEFSLAYDLPITAIPRPAALAAGGGEPGAAFLALVKAIQAKDARAAALHTPPDETPADPGPLFIEGLALNYPRQATVKSGLLKGRYARLEIEGTDHEDKKVTGTIDMRKLGANWRVTSLSMFFAQ